MISKKVFITLAEAYMRQEKYNSEIYRFIKEAAKKYGQTPDFVGLSSDDSVITRAVVDVLGDDFSYYYYDCGHDYDEFNNNIYLADGGHPAVHSLGELYDFSVENGSIKDDGGKE